MIKKTNRTNDFLLADLRRPFLPVSRPDQEKDYLSMFLVGALVLLGVQALYHFSVIAMCWVALAGWSLSMKKKLPIRLMLIVEAPVWFAMISHCVASLYMAEVEGNMSRIHSEEISGAMWVSLLGYASFALGMFLMLNLKFGKGREPMILSTQKQSVIIFFIGLFSVEILINWLPRSMWAVAAVFGFCMPVGLFMFFKHYIETEVKWFLSGHFLLWLLGLIYWIFRSVGGGIFGGTLLILLLFSSQYTQRSKLILVMLILIMGVSAPLLQDTKTDYKRLLIEDTTKRERKLVQVVSENFQRVFLEGDTDAYRDGIVALAARLNTFDIWFQVKKHMDHYQDFAGGNTIGDALIASFVPRAFWSEKPDTGGSNDLALKYAEIPILEGTSVGVGPISEFYINGGLPWVIFGMASIGFFSGGILVWGTHDRVQPLGLVMGIFMFSSFVRPETNLSDILGGSIRVGFIWGILRYWIIWQSPNVKNLFSVKTISR